MALRTTGAFAAGIAVGWIGRSMVGSTREAIVSTLVLVHRIRDRVRRTVAEQGEFLEDMFAEGRARYDTLTEEPPLDDDAPPNVIDAAKRRRERAA